MLSMWGVEADDRWRRQTTTCQLFRSSRCLPSWPASSFLACSCSA